MADDGGAVTCGGEETADGGELASCWAALSRAWSRALAST
jgi:hypothetical protein